MSFDNATKDLENYKKYLNTDNQLLPVSVPNQIGPANNKGESLLPNRSYPKIYSNCYHKSQYYFTMTFVNAKEYVLVQKQQNITSITATSTKSYRRPN